MFENIGGKIKVTTKVFTWIGIIASIIGAIALWAANSRYNPTGFIGFVVLVVGCLASWLGGFFLYGFGQLIENTDRTEYLSSCIDTLISEQKELNKKITALAESGNHSTDNHSAKEKSSVNQYLPEL